MKKIDKLIIIRIGKNAMDKVNIFVADHNLMVRNGLIALFNQTEGFDVVGEAGDSDETLIKVKKLRPDIILMESTLPMFTDFDTIRLIHSASPKTRVVVMAAELKKHDVRQALQGGAKGYILKTASFAELVKAIQSVCRGGYYLSSEIKTDIIENFLKQTDESPVHNKYNLLTRREKEVFRIIISGHTINEVAEILNISPKTVAKHRASLMEKLEIFNVASLVRYAIKIGVIAN